MRQDAREALGRWLRRLIARSELTAGEAEKILSLPGRFQDVARGRDIVRIGERTDVVSLVVSGLAGRFGETLEGNRQLVAVHIEGEIADLMAAVFSRACCAETAVHDCTLFRIPVGAIHELLHASPGLAVALWRDCCVDASIAEQWLFRNGQRNAPSRVAHLICELAVRTEVSRGSRSDFRLKLTQGTLGEMAGLTAVHINRTLRHLREHALISVAASEITITDWDRLTQFAEFDPSYLHIAEEPDALRSAAVST